MKTFYIRRVRILEDGSLATGWPGPLICVTRNRLGREMLEFVGGRHVTPDPECPGREARVPAGTRDRIQIGRQI